MTFNDNQCYPLFKIKVVRTSWQILSISLSAAGWGKERLAGKKFWTQFALQFNITMTFSRRPEDFIPRALSIGIPMLFTVC